MIVNNILLYILMGLILIYFWAMTVFIQKCRKTDKIKKWTAYVVGYFGSANAVGGLYIVYTQIDKAFNPLLQIHLVGAVILIILLCVMTIYSIF